MRVCLASGQPSVWKFVSDWPPPTTAPKPAGFVEPSKLLCPECTPNHRHLMLEYKWGTRCYGGALWRWIRGKCLKGSFGGPRWGHPWCWMC